MSFYATSLIFDGISSEQFGLMVANIESSKQDSGSFQKFDIQEERIASRNTGLYYGTISNNPLSFSVSLVSRDDNRHFDRYDMALIAGWLTGKNGYKKLSFCQPDMEHIYFNCIVTEVESIEVGMHKIGCSVTFQCDAPYAYRHMCPIVIRETNDYIYHNYSNLSGYYFPIIKVETSGTELSIDNITDGSRFFLSGMPERNKEITIDCQNQVMVSSDGTNLYSMWNIDATKQFPRFVRGDNHMNIVCDGTVTIHNDFPWNIGY